MRGERPSRPKQTPLPTTNPNPQKEGISMRQSTTCNHQPCHSYCPRLGQHPATEGRAPAQRPGIGALSATSTVTTFSQTRRVA